MLRSKDRSDATDVMSVEASGRFPQEVSGRMTTTTMISTRRPIPLNFNAPLVLDPPTHCGLSSIALVPGRHLIGTAASCGIRLHADGVVDRHALILVGENRTVVKSMDPHTWVNDGPVSEMALRPGDRLSVGPVTFRVRSATKDEAAAFAEMPMVGGDAASGQESFEPPATSPAVVASAHPVVSRPRTDVDPVGADPVGHAIRRTDSLIEVVRETSPTVIPVAVTVASTAPAMPLQGRPEKTGVSVHRPQASALPVVADADANTTIQAVADSLQAVNHLLGDAVYGDSVQSSRVAQTLTAESPESLSAEANDRAQFDSRLDEIQRCLSELRLTSQSIAPAAAATRPAATRPAPAETDTGHPLRQLQLRQEELQHRTEQIAEESQQLRERSDKVAEREAQVERRHQQLTLEAGRIATVAESARQHLAEEHARHVAVWHDWETAYQRMTGELATQLDAIEQQRARLQLESDRLTATRTEMKLARAEQEQDRQRCAADRVRLANDLAELASLKSQWEAQRRQHQLEADERHVQWEADRLELQGLRHRCQQAEDALNQLRRQRDVESSTLAQVRETELQMQAELQARLEEDRRQLEVERRELDELRRALPPPPDPEIQAARSAADLLERQGLKDRCQQAEDVLAQLRRQREVEASMLAQVRETDLRMQGELQARLDEERLQLEAERQELDELRRALPSPDPNDQDVQTAMAPLELQGLNDRCQQAEDALAQLRRQREVEATMLAHVRDTELRMQSELQARLEVDRRQLEAERQELDELRRVLPPPDDSSSPPKAQTLAPAPSLVQAQTQTLSPPLPLPPPLPSPVPPPIPSFPDPSGDFGVAVDWSALASVDREFGRSSVDSHPTTGDPADFSSTLVTSNTPSHWTEPESIRLSSQGDDPWARAAAASPHSALMHEVAESAADSWAASLRTASSMPESHWSAPESRSVMPQGNPGASGSGGDFESGLFADVSANVAEPFAMGRDEQSAADPSLSAGDTLAEVNRQFGVPADARPADAETVKSLPSWWVETSPAAGNSEGAADGERPIWVVDALRSETTESNDATTEFNDAPNPPADSVSELHARLAMLFDLPTNSAAESERPDSTDGGANPGDESPDESGELSGDDLSADRPADGTSESQSTSEPSTSRSEDAEPQAEDSVDEYMARLLARSRTGASEASPKVLAKSHRFIRLTTPAENPPVETVAPKDSKPDRSHLMNEPIHKQDRQAVRDNLQSFRQVAHLSARSALARHSLQQLRNATIAKGVLLGASAIAVTGFFTEPLWGGQLQLWKGIGCSIALLLSTLEFSRSWSQLQRPFKVPPELARVTEPGRVAEPLEAPVSDGEVATTEESTGGEVVDAAPDAIPATDE